MQDEAQHWTDGQLQCRTFGHAWRPHIAIHYRRWRYFRVTQLCERCDTARVIDLSERGQLLASSYRYPDGYLTRGLGRIAGDARDSLRMATLQRLFDVSDVRAIRDSEPPRNTAAARQAGVA